MMCIFPPKFTIFVNVNFSFFDKNSVLLFQAEDNYKKRQEKIHQSKIQNILTNNNYIVKKTLGNFYHIHVYRTVKPY